MQQPPDINYWLQRKYALLQQQADAGTMGAKANVTAANAAANLDTTRARVLPGQAASENAMRAANIGLTNEQASVVRPLASAQIEQIAVGNDLTRANTRLTDTNEQIAFREGLYERTPQLGSLFGGGPLPTIGSGSSFQLSGGRVARPPIREDYDQFGRRTAAGLERQNGF